MTSIVKQVAKNKFSDLVLMNALSNHSDYCFISTRSVNLSQMKLQTNFYCSILTVHACSSLLYKWYILNMSAPTKMLPFKKIGINVYIWLASLYILIFMFVCNLFQWISQKWRGLQLWIQLTAALFWTGPVLQTFLDTFSHGGTSQVRG